MTVSFSLNDLRRTLPGAETLDGLTGEALVAEVTRLLGPVAAGGEVSVNGDVVAVALPEVAASAAAEVDRLMDKAALRAKRGEYGKAESIYRRVLELNPAAMKARRELAMVLVELGRPEDAVGLLIDVLRADPRDAEALIILGNHYARRGGDQVVARRFLERAAEINPRNPLVHNSLAALHFEAKEPEAALTEFDRALALDPQFGHAHYGKSMVLMTEGRFPEARSALDGLFRDAKSADARSRPMLSAARDNYRKLTNILANDRASESLKAAEDLKARAVKASGYPVVVERDLLTGTLCGLTRMAWRHGRDSHLITLQSKLPAEMVAHHILAHEVSHILIESEARAAGCNRWLRTDDGLVAAAVRGMRRDIRQAARASGHDEEGLQGLAARLVQDGLSLLFNGPLDILIEQDLAEIPDLREAQFCSLFLQAHNAAEMGLKKETRSVVPAPLLRLNDAMNGAAALLTDGLFHGATDFFSRWSGSPHVGDARQIHALCVAADRAPCRGYELIDSVAELLGVSDWFSWKPDPGEFTVTERKLNHPTEGTVDPALLKSKAPEAVPLLLQALRRFDRMENRAIAEMTEEIAVLGQAGLRYSDATQTHTLKAAPGEKFTGLALMCLLYAGLQRLAPASADPGMNLHEEFAMALALYHAEKER